MDVLYFDIQKACDRVLHQRLLIKLKACGIAKSMISWIQTWLRDRRQRIIVEGDILNWKPVLGGVSQVSVFFIFINDLKVALSSNVLKFADDTKVFTTVKTDVDKDTK